MEYILKIENLKKSFKKNTVLDGLSINVEKGSIYGFIGKNGAGKTTTMKLVLGLLKFDSGKIEICGEKVEFGDTDVNKNIGYLPDVPSFYNYMTGLEYISFSYDLIYDNKKNKKNEIENLLKKVGLFGVKQRIGGYSRGMKQRLGIAQALIGKPKILICDEPTSALDPIGRKEILDILVSIKNETTVIFSTHILNDVQSICDHIGILNNGKLVLEGKIEEIEKDEKESNMSFSFSSIEDCNNTMKLLKNFKLEKTDNRNILLKSSKREEDTAYIFKKLGENNIPPIGFSVKRKTLEDIFIEVIR